MLLGSHMFVKFYDELITFVLIGIALCDSIMNHRWKQYSGLWLLLGIIAFYAIYSLSCVQFNTRGYVLMDALIEIKPYVAFFVFYSISPSLSENDHKWLRTITLSVASITAVVLSMGYHTTVFIFSHFAVAGAIMFLCAMIFWLCSVDRTGNLKVTDKYIILGILIAGLLCGRSKYYGYFILAVFFLFIYRPGFLSNFKVKHMVAIIALAVIVIAVAWEKFYFYFIIGSSDLFDPNVRSSFARPALYATALLILLDFFPFGCGLASFATYPSAANYSTLYYEYGLDKIYGLSPEMPDFIMDAFFPTLAQYGIVGIALFIWFWVFSYCPLRFMLRTDSHKYKYMFSIGSLIICYVLIESVGNTSFVQPTGQVAMMLLGIICGQGKRLMRQDPVPAQNSGMTDTTDHPIAKTIRHKI